MSEFVILPQRWKLKSYTHHIEQAETIKKNLGLEKIPVNLP